MSRILAILVLEIVFSIGMMEAYVLPSKVSKFDFDKYLDILTPIAPNEAVTCFKCIGEDYSKSKELAQYLYNAINDGAFVFKTEALEIHANNVKLTNTFDEHFNALVYIKFPEDVFQKYTPLNYKTLEKIPPKTEAYVDGKRGIIMTSYRDYIYLPVSISNTIGASVVSNNGSDAKLFGIISNKNRNIIMVTRVSQKEIDLFDSLIEEVKTPSNPKSNFRLSDIIQAESEQAGVDDKTSDDTLVSVFKKILHALFISLGYNSFAIKRHMEYFTDKNIQEHLGQMRNEYPLMSENIGRRYIYLNVFKKMQEDKILTDTEFSNLVQYLHSMDYLMSKSMAYRQYQIEDILVDNPKEDQIIKMIVDANSKQKPSLLGDLNKNDLLFYSVYRLICSVELQGYNTFVVNQEIDVNLKELDISKSQKNYFQKYQSILSNLDNKKNILIQTVGTKKTLCDTINMITHYLEKYNHHSNLMVYSQNNISSIRDYGFSCGKDICFDLHYLEQVGIKILKELSNYTEQIAVYKNSIEEISIQNQYDITACAPQSPNLYTP